MSGLRALAKQWVPCPVQDAARCVEEAFCQRLYLPSHLSLWTRSLMESSRDACPEFPERDKVLRNILDWLCRAQDAGGGGGVSAWYSLAEGWSPPYPETTGYIIVTFLEASGQLNEPAFGDSARRMADWEVSVQLEDGSWQSGLVGAPRRPAVFNTGQALQGLVAAHSAFGDPSLARAAERGAAWLVRQQDDDGIWRRHTFNEVPHAYYARVAWPLADFGQRAGDRRALQAAIRNLDWTIRQQTDDGWFRNCAFSPDELPLTHTLAYAIEGLVEAGVILQNERWITAGQRAAESLLLRFERRRRLAGTYGPSWKGDYTFSCVTGCAQMSRIWGRLFELMGDARFLNAALKMNDYLVSVVNWRSRNPAVRAGLPGSDPIWGPYMRFRFPNWAAKFGVDALLQEKRALAITSRFPHAVIMPQPPKPEGIEGQSERFGWTHRPSERNGGSPRERAGTSGVSMRDEFVR